MIRCPWFESSVKSYDTKTPNSTPDDVLLFESSVKSYDTKTYISNVQSYMTFESSVKSYDTKTLTLRPMMHRCLRVV